MENNLNKYELPTINDELSLKLRECIENNQKEEVINALIDFKKNELLNADDITFKRLALSSIHLYHRRGLAKTKEKGKDYFSGAIVYCDFGDAYSREVGYQHMAIVLKTFDDGKVLVLPLTSNKNRFLEDSPYLFPLGEVHGLPKNTNVAYLNDIKSINSTRILCMRGYIPKKLLKKIRKRVQEFLD